MMPEVDGWSVLGELRLDPQTQDIPIVMISMVDERRRGFSLGCDGYLTKPVSNRELLQALAACGASGERTRVLVVDDDPVVRSFITSALERSGYDVVQAQDGVEALQAVDQGRPSAILLDLMMPRLDGFGFLKAIQGRADLAEVPILVLTAASLDEAERMFLHRSVTSILEKNAKSHAEILRTLATRIERFTGTRKAG